MTLPMPSSFPLWSDEPAVHDLVREVRFLGWQESVKGDRDIRRELRRTMHEQGLADDAVYDRANAYVREHYRRARSTRKMTPACSTCPLVSGQRHASAITAR